MQYKFQREIMSRFYKSGAIVFLGALSISFILRLIYPTTFHQFDVKTFVEWGQFTNPFQDVYLTSCYCNYPIIGMILSTGLLKLFDYHIGSFLFFLCFIDAINVILIWILMKILKLPNALFWSGLIGLSLSSWAGGAYWGQIDNVGQFFLLLILLMSYFFTKNLKTNDYHFDLRILIIGFIISVSLLTKQLLVFPLIPIVIFISICILFNTNGKQRISYLISFIFSVLFPIFLLDLWLNLPEKYFFSHFERIFDTGSEHINSIAGNGFNMWVLFYSDLDSASTKEIFFKLSPKIIGIFLFFAFSIWMCYQMIKGLQIFRGKGKENFIYLLGFYSFYNLLFNLVLTGTHERYLYHLYPVLLVFFLAIHYSKLSEKVITKLDFIVVFVGSMIYGYFILKVLNHELKSLNFHRFLFVFHLILFVRLMIVLVKFRKKSVST